MNNRIYLISFILVLSLALAGCVIRESDADTKPLQEESLPDLPQEVEESDTEQTQPQQVEALPDVKPANPTTTIRQPTTKEGASEKPVPFDKTEEWETLTIDSYRLERISRDKGEVAEITFTVRNMGSKKLSSEVVLWFHTNEIPSAGVPDVQEKKYDMPALEPGYKVTKTFPLTMRFHELDRRKKFTLMLKERFVSPSPELYRTEKSFVPEEELAGMPISWT